MRADVIGAGLAGCEAAWQLAKAGVQVRLFEMKPEKYSPAHKYQGFAEPQPWRAQTKFERKGLKADRSITELYFEKV